MACPTTDNTAAWIAHFQQTYTRLQHNTDEAEVVDVLMVIEGRMERAFGYTDYEQFELYLEHLLVPLGDIAMERTIVASKRLLQDYKSIFRGSIDTVDTFEQIQNMCIFVSSVPRPNLVKGLGLAIHKSNRYPNEYEEKYFRLLVDFLTGITAAKCRSAVMLMVAKMYYSESLDDKPFGDYEEKYTQLLHEYLVIAPTPIVYQDRCVEWLKVLMANFNHNDAAAAYEYLRPFYHTNADYTRADVLLMGLLGYGFPDIGRGTAAVQHLQPILLLTHLQPYMGFVSNDDLAKLLSIATNTNNTTVLSVSATEEAIAAKVHCMHSLILLFGRGAINKAVPDFIPDLRNWLTFTEEYTQVHMQTLKKLLA